ncbi:MAG: choice-of-anchor D domain-containing protein, partial [Bacteroidota bacterium]
RGIYKSTNLGITWGSISSNLPQQGIEMLSLTINPDNNQEMFLATVFSQTEGSAFRLFKTTNGGFAWDSLNQRLPVYDVEYDRYDRKRLVAVGPGGIFGTKDGGVNWNILWPPSLQNPFFLLGSHAKDANIYYSGSRRGVWRIQIEDRPKLESDSLYYFGSLLLGNDTTLSITVSNKNGLRNVIVYFAGISDTNNFQYLGPSTFTLAAGDTITVVVQYKPQVAGLRSAVLRFISSDPSVGVLQIHLRGHSFERYSFEKFTYDFGSVAVGDDSVVTFDIDNTFGLRSIQVNYVGNTDTLSFTYEGSKSFTLDTGATISLPVRFTPKSAGQKQAYIAFKTTDIRFPNVILRFQGTGIVKNFTKRRVLLDTSLGFVSPDGSTLSEYYKLWELSLERAKINVDFQKVLPLANYNAVVYVQPPTTLPPVTIDSLQKFIMNGGTVVLLGEHGTTSRTSFNTFLHDSTWTKYNVKTGIQFNGDLVWDEALKDSCLSGYVAAYSASKNALTYKIDSVVLMTPGSLKVDTTVINVVPLLSATAPTLFTTEDT